MRSRRCIAPRQAADAASRVAGESRRPAFSKGNRDLTTNTALPSWNDSATKAAILDFVARVTNEGAKSFVLPEARIAVFDNDGTLWCELPIQADFLLDKIGEQAAKDASLRDRQPWKAVWEKDYKWLSDAIKVLPPASLRMGKWQGSLLTTRASLV